MHFKVAALVLAVCFLAASTALKCNLCAGSAKSDCANNVSAAMMSTTCRHPHRFHRGMFSTTPATPADTATTEAPATNSSSNESGTDKPGGSKSKFDMYCVSFTTTDGSFLSSGAERGCALAPRNTDVCKFLGKVFDNLDKCSSCQEDNCN